jgi:hypothetical protein
MGSQDNIIKGHCPNCGSGRKAYVRSKHVVDLTDDDDGTAASDTGMILECCGCERVYFRRDYWFSEWDMIVQHPITLEPMMERGVETTYWPAPIARRRPTWIAELEEADRGLGNLLTEMYTALDNGLRIVSAIAVRTVFDRASELLGIDPALTFKEKLDKLGANGKISIDEGSTLEVLVDAGSAAAHRGWRPQTEELKTMVDLLESFLHRSFILGEGIARLKAAVPPKPKRSKT